VLGRSGAPPATEPRATTTILYGSQAGM
jgi:hypothetical protein